MAAYGRRRLPTSVTDRLAAVRGNCDVVKDGTNDRDRPQTTSKVVATVFRGDAPTGQPGSENDTIHIVHGMR